MNLIFALAAAILFGAGAYLLLHRDLVRLAFGVVVISQAAVLTLLAASLQRGAAPIHPLPEGPVSDPLSQAMALTAIVIGMAVTAFLFVLILRVATAFDSRALDDIAAAEARNEELEAADAQAHGDAGAPFG